MPAVSPSSPGVGHRVAAGALTTVLGVGAALVAAPPTPAAAAGATSTGDPLTVTLTSVSPSTLPLATTGEQLTVTGRVTNVGRETWTDVNVYPVLGTRPMLTTAELRAAARLPADAVIGDRDLDPDDYAEVGDLAPGASGTFTVRIGAADAGVAEAGVYWLGAQALGALDGDRDSLADGRARTFVTLVPPGSATTSSEGPAAVESIPDLGGGSEAELDLSVVLPLRGGVRRGAEGRLVEPEQVAASLGSDGRLGRVLALGSQAGARATWIVDPALVDAAASLSSGNPPFVLEPTAGAGADRGSDEPSDRIPPPEPSDSASQSTERPPPGDTLVPQPSPDPARSTRAGRGEAAALWLASFETVTDDPDVTVLPYGDPDVSALARDDRGVLWRRALQLTSEATGRLGLDAPLVVAPPDGFVRPSAVAPEGLVQPSTPVLLSGRAVRTGEGITPPALTVDDLGRSLLVADEAVQRGGPDGGLDALGLRQQVLAQAAVRVLDAREANARPAFQGAARPSMIAMPPADWDPGADWAEADFLGGLQVPWLRAVGLPDSQPTFAEQPQARLRYPEARRRAEIGPGLVSTVRRTVALGDALDGVLARNDTIGDEIARAGMTELSWQVRSQPGPAAQDAAGQAVTSLQLLRRVRLEVPSLVTMSSSTGTITVKLLNGLDQPVSVGIDAQVSSNVSDPSLVIDSPGTVDVPAQQQATLRLDARASQTGLNVVELVPTSPDGRPIGFASTLNVRAGTLGVTIYRLMGGLGALLLVVVVLRVWRRIRTRKATPGPLLKRQESRR